MDPSAILVTGGRGALGSALARKGCNSLSRDALDITDPASIDAALRMHRPRLVINAAAYTAVDRAESEQDAAHRINVDGAGFLAEACASSGIPLIHISTDMVFSTGDPARPFKETDEPTPNSVYGRTKLEGERAALASGGRVTAARVSWLFSTSHPNFIGKILTIAQGRQALDLVDDEIGRPTPLDALADKLISLAGIMADGKATPEILHLGPSDPVSRYGWAKLIFAASADLGGPCPQLAPVPASAFPAPATRPRGVVLDVGLADKLLGAMPEWRPASQQVVADFLQAPR